MQEEWEGDEEGRLKFSFGVEKKDCMDGCQVEGGKEGRR